MSAQQQTVVYVSHGKSNDIHVLSLDVATGALTPIDRIVAPGVARPGNSLPLAVSPDRRFLYAAVRGEPLIALTFAIDPRSGRLRYLGSGPLADIMAYISIDGTGRFLFGASYQGGRIAVHDVSPEGIAHSVRQVALTEPKAHSVIIDRNNRYVHAAILGGDMILSLPFDDRAGMVAEGSARATKTKAGAGPRHIVFHPQAPRLYLVNELDATVSAFDYDESAGALTEIQTISALPPNFSGKPWAADIHITRNGRFLYASERTSSTLAIYAIDPASGRLTLQGHSPTETQPRAFAIDPSGRYLLSVGEMSNGLTNHAIDGESGLLRDVARLPMGDGPNWVEIIHLP
ncbi:MAG: hypothetical protein BGP06_02000 [Rhizobiales bacterium 65-9]|nr:lactonase family protein [Hyphomicrobiales bacterium]OJY34260.1 MAG: hypothetical protein BGP06_02000 [Rhizobiales bacterium 65-9]